MSVWRFVGREEPGIPGQDLDIDGGYRKAGFSPSGTELYWEPP